MAACSMTVDALLTGMPVPFRDGEHSAIAKRPVSGAVRIGWLGLEGDGVADSVHHGGWDKAIHLYPQYHYVWRRDREPGPPPLRTRGAFRGNNPSLGRAEGDIYLGDRFSPSLAVGDGETRCRAGVRTAR